MPPEAARPAGLPAADRCLVMGVVNVTPDSFSDGGACFDPDAAIEHGLRLAAQGADIVDVGGESTRPGALRISEQEELRRIRPVITALAGAGVPVSIDTMRAAVAEFALEAGATLVNDVSGGLADPAMAGLIAAAAVPFVVMHWRGHSADMQNRAVYRDVISEVRAELAERLDALESAGVDPARLIIDPGLGFAKQPEHNWALLARLQEVARPRAGPRRYPVLVGSSRKRFIGRLLTGPDGGPRQFTGCDDATVALTALAAVAGAWCVRVHAAQGNADAVRVAARWLREARGIATTPDRVVLLGLKAHGRHGVLDRERSDGQEFIVDAVLHTDTRAAAAADQLSLTVDYGALADRLAGIISGEPVALIETLADRLATACLADDRVLEAEITVHKPHAPVGQPVSDIQVVIRRGRR